MNSWHRKILLAGFATVACVSLGRATDLRGAVDTINPASHASGPQAGVAVGLFIAKPDGTYSVVRQGVTGPNGVFYLAGVPAGQYVLQVGGVNYPLRVLDVATQDIPIIHK